VTEIPDDAGDSELGRPTTRRLDWTDLSLEDPTVSRTTLARRLRTVERALGGVETFEEFDSVDERGSVSGDLDAVEERLVALERAVHAIGEHLTALERAHRAGAGLEAVRRAVEGLPEAASGTDANEDGPGDTDCRPRTEATTGESPAEWLDRVAAGGVTPPAAE
jgi:hypothetical protein